MVVISSDNIYYWKLIHAETKLFVFWRLSILLLLIKKNSSIIYLINLLILSINKQKESYVLYEIEVESSRLLKLIDLDNYAAHE